MLFYCLLKVASVVIPRFPVAGGYVVCGLVGNLLYLLNGTARRNVAGNLRRVLGSADPAKIKQATKRVFRYTVQNYYDLFRLPHLSKPDVQALLDLKGVEHLEEALATGKGVIFLSGHLGNFNLSAQILAVRGHRMTIVVEQLKSEQMQRLLEGLRESQGINFVPLGGNEARTIYKALRRNEIVGVMGDRDVAANGIPVTFFGETAYLPSGPAALAIRTGASIVTAYTIRKADGSSLGFIDPPVELDETGDFRRDIQTTTQKIAQRLERYIREAPDQWTVLQPIWNDNRRD
ncbi:MAG: lipid A biosynthesis acyltransferase [Chloroflexi bacterium]|nr:lipid A biosynthesis acyltransferase [Chloroflexota bacterium]